MNNILAQRKGQLCKAATAFGRKWHEKEEMKIGDTICSLFQAAINYCNENERIENEKWKVLVKEYPDLGKKA